MLKLDKELIVPMESHTNSATYAPSRAFKYYLVVSMICIWTVYSLLVRNSRKSVDGVDVYISSTVVVVTEFVKASLSIIILYVTLGRNRKKFTAVMNDSYFGKPTDLLRMSLSSIAYSIQNNTDFIALSNLDAATYQIFAQLKIISVALFMIILMRRRFSFRRWLALFLLFIGIVIVQCTMIEDVKKNNGNTLIGLIAVLISSLVGGFAGVYFEWMMKNSSTPIWIRNLQLYTCGFISAVFFCLARDKHFIYEEGFFYGYNLNVTVIIGLLSVGGIYTSLVMKHLDTVHKSFAFSVTVVFVVAISTFVTNDKEFNYYFIMGSSIVCVAIFLYNSVAE